MESKRLLGQVSNSLEPVDDVRRRDGQPTRVADVGHLLPEGIDADDAGAGLDVGCGEIGLLFGVDVVVDEDGDLALSHERGRAPWARGGCGMRRCRG